MFTYFRNLLSDSDPFPEEKTRLLSLEDYINEEKNPESGSIENDEYFSLLKTKVKKISGSLVQSDYLQKPLNFKYKVFVTDMMDNGGKLFQVLFLGDYARNASSLGLTEGDILYILRPVVFNRRVTPLFNRQKKEYKYEVIIGSYKTEPPTKIAFHRPTSICESQINHVPDAPIIQERFNATVQGFSKKKRVKKIDYLSDDDSGESSYDFMIKSPCRRKSSRLEAKNQPPSEDEVHKKKKNTSKSDKKNKSPLNELQKKKILDDEVKKLQRNYHKETVTKEIIESSNKTPEKSRCETPTLENNDDKVQPPELVDLTINSPENFLSPKKNPAKEKLVEVREKAVDKTQTPKKLQSSKTNNDRVSSPEKINEKTQSPSKSNDEKQTPINSDNKKRTPEKVNDEPRKPENVLNRTRIRKNVLKKTKNSSKLVDKTKTPEKVVDNEELNMEEDIDNREWSPEKLVVRVRTPKNIGGRKKKLKAITSSSRTSKNINKDSEETDESIDTLVNNVDKVNIITLGPENFDTSFNSENEIKTPKKINNSMQTLDVINTSVQTPEKVDISIQTQHIDYMNTQSPNKPKDDQIKPSLIEGRRTYVPLKDCKVGKSGFAYYNVWCIITKINREPSASKGKKLVAGICIIDETFTGTYSFPDLPLFIMSDRYEEFPPLIPGTVARIHSMRVGEWKGHINGTVFHCKGVTLAKLVEEDNEIFPISTVNPELLWTQEDDTRALELYNWWKNLDTAERNAITSTSLKICQVKSYVRFDLYCTIKDKFVKNENCFVIRVSDGTKSPIISSRYHPTRFDNNAYNSFEIDLFVYSRHDLYPSIEKGNMILVTRVLCQKSDKNYSFSIGENTRSEITRLETGSFVDQGLDSKRFSGETFTSSNEKVLSSSPTFTQAAEKYVNESFSLKSLDEASQSPPKNSTDSEDFSTPVQSYQELTNENLALAFRLTSQDPLLTVEEALSIPGTSGRFIVKALIRRVLPLDLDSLVHGVCKTCRIPNPIEKFNANLLCITCGDSIKTFFNFVLVLEDAFEEIKAYVTGYHAELFLDLTPKEYRENAYQRRKVKNKLKLFVEGKYAKLPLAFVKTVQGREYFVLNKPRFL